MKRSDYDVVIVGARCSGAPLATFLTRAGASVLLLDRDRLPSDQVLSTHIIHPPGVDILDELGVGEAVRAEAPASRVIRLVKDEAIVDLELGPGRAQHCPRRERLDGLLQQAALDAGAELHDRTRVTALIRHDERVAGVVAQGRGKEFSIRAPLVVGADGRHSTVAAELAAPEYLAYDAPRAIYWSYWKRPPLWTSTDYPFGTYLANRAGNARSVFQTDHGQLLIASLPPVSDARDWRADPLTALTADLATDPVIAPLIAGAAPTEKVRGTFHERYFFRQGAGPGWALAGDAGHHKDFILGDGITEALLQAKSLASAIGAGTDRALERWWRQRDVEALPHYFFGREEGAPEPSRKLQRIALAKLAQDPELQARMTRAIEHQLSPLDVVPLPKAVAWALAALLKGKVQPASDLASMVRGGIGAQREITRRKKLLSELDHG